MKMFELSDDFFFRRMLNWFFLGKLTANLDVALQLTTCFTYSFLFT